MPVRWVLSLTLLGALLAAAQYSPGTVLNPEPVTLRGTVSEIEWINPHVWIHLSIPSPDGAIVNWRIAVASLQTLEQEGVSKNSLKPGDRVSVDVFVLKDGSRLAEAKQGGFLTLATGQRVRLPFWVKSGASVSFSR